MAIPAETLTYTGEHINHTIEDKIAETIGGDITAERVAHVIESLQRGDFFVSGIGEKTDITEAITSGNPLPQTPLRGSSITGKEVFANPYGAFSRGTPFFDSSHGPYQKDTSTLTLAVTDSNSPATPKDAMILHAKVTAHNGIEPRKKGQLAEQTLFRLLEKGIEDFVPGGIRSMQTTIHEDGSITSTPMSINHEYPQEDKTEVVVPDLSNVYSTDDPELIEQFIEIASTGEQNTVMERHILPWAKNLPEINGIQHIADLASGIGREAKKLAENGFDVTALDSSEIFVENSFHTKAVLAKVTELPFENESLSGAYLKDALLFLSPEDREKMLVELQRTLVDGGSLLISSENQHTLRMRLESHIGNRSYKEDTPDDTYWISFYNSLNSGNTDYSVTSVHFICTVDRMEKLAKKHGFIFEIVEQYDSKDKISQENRWIKGKGGFIVKLTKPLTSPDQEK